MARRKLKTSKAEREANARRRRWRWFHRKYGAGPALVDAGYPTVRRRKQPTHTPDGCLHSVEDGTGEWRPTRAL